MHSPCACRRGSRSIRAPRSCAAGGPGGSWTRPGNSDLASEINESLCFAGFPMSMLMTIFWNSTFGRKKVACSTMYLSTCWTPSRRSRHPALRNCRYDSHLWIKIGLKLLFLNCFNQKIRKNCQIMTSLTWVDATRHATITWFSRNLSLQAWYQTWATIFLYLTILKNLLAWACSCS